MLGIHTTNPTLLNSVDERLSFPRYVLLPYLRFLIYYVWVLGFFRLFVISHVCDFYYFSSHFVACDSFLLLWIFFFPVCLCWFFKRIGFVFLYPTILINLVCGSLSIYKRTIIGFICCNWSFYFSLYMKLIDAILYVNWKLCIEVSSL